jgi:hypothetical protein
MAFTDHPENKGFPADLSEGFTLWNLVIQLSQSYETVHRCHIGILDAMLKGDGNQEAKAKLVAKNLELAQHSQTMIADVHKILEDHRMEIAGLPVKQ